MKDRESSSSDSDAGNLTIEMKDRPNPLPEAQQLPKAKLGQRALSATSDSLTTPLLDDSSTSLPRVNSLQSNSYAKYRPAVTENYVHTTRVTYRCVDWLYFSAFLAGLYGGLLALLYALLAATEQDSYSTGIACLVVLVLLAVSFICVIIRGEIKHCSSKRRSAQGEFPSVH